MAVARYWVGGSGTWDLSTTTNWSATSGGAGGASAPTSVDFCVFDANSGSGTVTLTVSGFLYIGGLSFSGCSGINFSSGSTTISTINVTYTGTNSMQFGGVSVQGDTFTANNTSSITLSSADFQFRVWTGGSSMSNAGSTVVLTGTGSFTTAGENYGTVQFSGGNTTVSSGASVIQRFRIVTGSTVVQLTGTVIAEEFACAVVGAGSGITSSSPGTQRTLQLSGSGIRNFSNILLKDMSISSATYVTNGVDAGNNTNFRFNNNSGALAFF